MAFVDELTIYAKAGSGGNGVVRWRHIKSKEFGGPAGGNGGNGGDVYAVGVRDIHILEKYPARKSFLAECGEDGRNDDEFGKNGDDLLIEFPLGSIITNKKTKERILIEKEGDKKLMLKGAGGGRGNASFKSSTNRSPQDATNGGQGEDADFHIELQLIADVGLVGFPNAGKTSLLNELTNATAKIGAYPFTTLEPNLGEMYGYILADIPGLIEGAAEGKGLGHKFLRHIARTKILVHAISLEEEDVKKAYEGFRKELSAFDKNLLEKKEIVLLTKTDIGDEEKILKAKAELANSTTLVLSASVYDDKSLKELAETIVGILRNDE
ncbi:MAG: GTPase ObgE [bacterium]|nr:GTPase ObgE [bacterium]